MENGCTGIFDEEAANVERNRGKRDDEPKERISGKTINELAKKLVNFLESKFASASRDEIQSVCQSAIELFTTIGGIVSSF